ncbi:hypothetical protein CVS30_12605 [Arthrobacter psychrolactophilus]|uniref:GAP family protein n=1 Tax=Arthrobacter psychrolactophilus TaxID=92442 RepID=A0A2V5IVB9_9MICC|nr:GAP family protein [Arthrobacter psychrolactophilus]PYI38053.1 hypothetical protein CVS30_12605 [Arthrobacter psychrolactophilus]
MIDLAWELIPALLGIVASPLAIIAMIAVLLSRNSQQNGIMYWIGWTCAVLISVGLGYWIFARIEVDLTAEPPAWVPVVRFIFGLFLVAGAVWTYRRSRLKLTAMARADSLEDVVAAAPQLPGWLKTVDTFTAPRSFCLGLGIFLLNPINLSCAAVAALDIRLADLSTQVSMTFLIVFMILCIVPFSVPVILTLLQREKAGPVLERMRGWIVKNNANMSTIFLSLLAFMQIQKSLAELPWF